MKYRVGLSGTSGRCWRVNLTELCTSGLTLEQYMARLREKGGMDVAAARTDDGLAKKTAKRL